MACHCRATCYVRTTAYGGKLRPDNPIPHPTDSCLQVACTEDVLLNGSGLPSDFESRDARALSAGEYLQDWQASSQGEGSSVHLNTVGTDRQFVFMYIAMFLTMNYLKLVNYHY